MTNKENLQRSIQFLCVAVVVFLVMFNILVIAPAINLRREIVRDVLISGLTTAPKKDIDTFAKVLDDIEWYKHYKIETENRGARTTVTVYKERADTLLNVEFLTIGVVFDVFMVVALLACVYHVNREE